MSKSESGLFVLGRRKPKPTMTFSGFSATLKKITASSEMSLQIELIGALRRWINEARPDLRVVASGEEFETFKSEFFDSQGAQTFDVMINFLKKSKLAYIKQHKPPAKTRLREIGGRTAPATLKAAQIAQECRASAERVKWDRVARRVLRNPGKPSTKTKSNSDVEIKTWAQRVKALSSNVKNYEQRQRASKKVS
jgi:hypothetical protein